MIFTQIFSFNFKYYIYYDVFQKLYFLFFIQVILKGDFWRGHFLSQNSRFLRPHLPIFFELENIFKAKSLESISKDIVHKCYKELI